MGMSARGAQKDDSSHAERGFLEGSRSMSSLRCVRRHSYPWKKEGKAKGTELELRTHTQTNPYA
jgi:hypothetical protein